MGKTTGGGRLPFRRWTMVIVVVVGLFGAACSSSDGESNGAASTTTTAEETAAGASTATSTAEPEEDPEPEPIVIGTEPTEIHVQDFESETSDRWSFRDVATTADDRKVLGPIGAEGVLLEIDGLTDHHVVSISFDLLILGDWNGGGGNDNRWLLSVDEALVVDTTFSNTEAEQGYPANLPADTVAAGTEAVERANLELTGAAVAQDSVYRIERQFLHSGDTLTFEFLARRLGMPDEQAWALDNVVVTAQAVPDREPVTNLVLTVVDEDLTVEGVVPTAEDLRVLTETIGLRYEKPPNLDNIEVGSGGPGPLWLYDVEAIGRAMALAHDLRLEVGETTATTSGTIRTSRWADIFNEELSFVFGRTLQPSHEYDIKFSDEIVDRLAGLDLLFDTGSAALDDTDRENLDAVVELLNEEPELLLEISGHTDSTGEVDTNRDLSRLRANAALNHLVSAGIDGDRLVAFSRGVLQLRVDPEETDDDRAQNRRVSFGIPRG